MPDICFITTCRGRREHLEQSLPRFAAQPDTECVVVDYDCPDGAGDWVEAAYPQVKLVRAGRQPKFEISRARNLGAQAAQAPWLCFVDADALVAPDFADTVRPLLKRGSYYRPMPEPRNGTGTCICQQGDFEAIGGYDAVLQGWGMEDKDFYARLQMASVKPATIPGRLVETIRHSDAMRVKHYDIKQFKLNSTLNLVYCRAKWDLMRLGRPLRDEAERASLYQTVSVPVLDAHARGISLQLRVPVTSQESLSGATLKTSLVYELGAMESSAPAPAKGPATRRP